MSQNVPPRPGLSPLRKSTSKRIHSNNNKKNKKMVTQYHHSTANTIDSPNGEELYPTVRDNISKSKYAAENTLQSHEFQQKLTNNLIDKDSDIKRNLSTEIIYKNNNDSEPDNVILTISSNSNERSDNMQSNSKKANSQQLHHNNKIMSNNNTLNSTKIDNALYQKNAKATEDSTNQYKIPNK